MRKKGLIDTIMNNKKVKTYLNHLNKIHFIAAFFVLFSLIIIWKMFTYTVVDYKFYKTLADKQQI